MIVNKKELEGLTADYLPIKDRIGSRLKEFENHFATADDASLFKELVFCLFTPQSKARSCWSAVERVCDRDLLLDGSAEEISAAMSGVRFHHTKARRVVEARRILPGFKARMTSFEGPLEAREWLIANINGMSYKEASHFLRNIGMGRDLAILDRHILKNLVRLGVIDEVPRHLSPKRYLEIEARMAEFSRKAAIPMNHLDMLLWYREAGEIFK